MIKSSSTTSLARKHAHRGKQSDNGCIAQLKAVVLDGSGSKTPNQSSSPRTPRQRRRTERILMDVDIPSHWCKSIHPPSSHSAWNSFWNVASMAREKAAKARLRLRLILEILHLLPPSSFSNRSLSWTLWLIPLLPLNKPHQLLAQTCPISTCLLPGFSPVVHYDLMLMTVSLDAQQLRLRYEWPPPLHIISGTDF